MKLRINEILGPTIQGEGIWTGCPSMFVRFQGCSLRCPHCDTKHSWGHQKPSMSLEAVKKKLTGSTRDVVITGGEPLDADHIEGVVALACWAHSCGQRVTIETSGCYARERSMPAVLLNAVDLWSVSPKLPAMGLEGPRANPLFAGQIGHMAKQLQLKFVVSPQTLDDDLSMIQTYLQMYKIDGYEPTVHIVCQVTTKTTGQPKEMKQQILNDWTILVQRILEVPWLRQLRPQVLPQAHRLIGVD